MRKDAYLTLTCDHRDLATIFKFLVSQGYHPRSKSDLGRKAIEEYARSLRDCNLAPTIGTIMEALEILEPVFGAKAFNPSGRVGESALVSMQKDSGIELPSPKATETKASRKKKIDPQILEHAKFLHYSHQIEKMSVQERMHWYAILECEGIVPRGTTQALTDWWLETQQAACTSPDAVKSTEDTSEREKRDREELQRLKTGMGPGMVPGPDQMVKDS